MAQALGARLRDAQGHALSYGGAALAGLASIALEQMDARLANCTFEVACDVNNPLCGPMGASAVYGPQKGATPAMVAQLDAALAHYAQIVERDLGQTVRDVPGAGAAGGLGDDYQEIYKLGIDGIAVLPSGPMSLEYAMEHASRLISEATERTLRIFKAGRITQK